MILPLCRTFFCGTTSHLQFSLCWFLVYASQYITFHCTAGCFIRINELFFPSGSLRVHNLTWLVIFVLFFLFFFFFFFFLLLSLYHFSSMYSLSLHLGVNTPLPLLFSLSKDGEYGYSRNPVSFWKTSPSFFGMFSFSQSCSAFSECVWTGNK